MTTTGFTPSPLPPMDETSLKWVRILRAIFDPLTLLEKRRDRLGEIIRMNSASVVLGHPDHISELFARDGRELSVPGLLNSALQPLLGNQSLLMLSGDRHRHRRKLLLPPFHGKALQSYGNIIQRIAQEMFDQ
ncbi:MAG: cytochrome P450, partial [Cyanophyceae cyanobacterium]